jgi:hypothetical protein
LGFWVVFFALFSFGLAPRSIYTISLASTEGGLFRKLLFSKLSSYVIFASTQYSGSKKKAHDLSDFILEAINMFYFLVFDQRSLRGVKCMQSHGGF